MIKKETWFIPYSCVKKFHKWKSHAGGICVEMESNKLGKVKFKLNLKQQLKDEYLCMQK